MSVPPQQFRNHSIPLDILDELAARFIIPMREEERADLVRVSDALVLGIIPGL